MILQSNCPQFDRLQALFDGTATKDVQQELAKHLDHCDECQRQFEQLASDPGFLQDVARSQGHEQGRPDKVLQYLVHDLSARFRRATEKNAETADEQQVSHDTLDFLEPSNNKQHLGRIDDYEVIEVIGRGGMGVVLKAIDPKLNRVVALKVIAPELACNAEARKRFFREAQAAAAVSHHHVVTLHAVDDSDKRPYLVMEYISGQSLHERIRRSGSLELREILRIGRQTALGLAAAHAVGLVHRDLKPANILLENGIERVKLTDFGLARAADDVNLTQTGYVAGTPLYMSPEQAHSETLDARSDLFSLGSVLYTMCTGQPPFNAKSTYGVIRQVCEGSPRPIWDVNPDIPQWLVEIIDRLMAKDPDQRFQSASEVAELLAEHLIHLEQPKRSSSFDFGEVSAPVVKELPRPQPPKRRWSLLIASLMVVLGGLVVTEALGVTNVTELIATVLHIRTPHGTLVVEIEDPDVKVTVEGEGEDIVISGLGEHEVRLRPGKHQWRAVRNGKPDRTNWVTITRGGKKVVRVSHLEAPEAAGRAQPKRVPADDESRNIDATPFSDSPARVGTRSVSPPPADTPRVRWHPIRSMDHPRADHTAIRLGDDTILVAGGTGPDGATASCEIYDPTQDAWHATASMSAARSVHDAVFLADGRVLVFGGRVEGGDLASAEIYDPVRGTWSETGSLSISRYRGSVNRLDDGRVLVAGGWNRQGFLNTAEIFEPATGQFRPTGSMQSRRNKQIGVKLRDGRILVAGGYRGGSSRLATAEVFDPVSETWSPTASMGATRYVFAAVLLNDNTVLAVAGGGRGRSRHKTAEFFNIATNTWHPTGSLANVQSDNRAVKIPDGSVLAIGSASRATEVYDPGEKAWAAAGNLKEVRRGCTATCLSDGRVIVVGGQNDLGYLKSAEAFSPAEELVPRP